MNESSGKHSLFLSNNPYPKLLVLGCEVMEGEIRRFQKPQVEFKFLDYGLHRTPESMCAALQAEIDQASKQDYDGVILGYGLCSNGIVGITSKRQTLIVPRVHDCISLFLGSSSSYQYQARRYPGTYYLTPGWIEKGETPISKYESYVQSYDEETARWVLHEEMKNYTRVVLIDTGVYAIEPFRRIACSNAEFLGVSFQELQGSSAFFKTLVRGPWGRNFLVLERGHAFQQEMFLDL